jgi:hypothetical protein
MPMTRSELDILLSGAARAWLDGAVTEARKGLPAWELRFAAAGRECGQEHADSVRIHILTEARPGAPALTRLYRQGTASERRAVLLALQLLAVPPGNGVPLIEDALRTNDTSLVAAAAGPYAGDHLGPSAWRQAVLKCLFTGVPVDAVGNLESRARADAELARMLRDYAAERAAAGRDIPQDLRRVLALTAESRTAAHRAAGDRTAEEQES